MSEIDDDLIDRHRWVSIMCDFSADGVWDIEGRACSAEDLPVPQELVERFRCWQAHYEEIEIAADEEGDPVANAIGEPFPPKASPSPALSRPRCRTGP